MGRRRKKKKTKENGKKIRSFQNLNTSVVIDELKNDVRSD